MGKSLIRGKQSGFTLAEVLITLGIIGVVATMTLPTLVQNYQKRVVETRLQKFYSNINQAVQLAEVQYGDKKIWYEDFLAGASFDKDGNLIEGSSKIEKWFNKYFAPHLKITKQETLSDGTFIVYFSDGSALRQLNPSITRDWIFFPGNPQKCLKTDSVYDRLGVCAFSFVFCPIYDSSSWRYHTNKGMEPYKFAWNGANRDLYYSISFGCKNGGNRSYCTAIIQNNNWKIPDDYPYKVSY